MCSMMYDDPEKTHSPGSPSKTAGPISKGITSASTSTQQPAWTQAIGAHPPVGLQTTQVVNRPANIQEQRAFVVSSIEFLHVEAEFYRTGAVVSEARLSSQLTHMREILLSSLQIIHTALNNDAALENDLKLAYQDAVQALMNAAAGQLKCDIQQLYATYRDQIQEWVNLYPTATPVGKDAALKDDGSAILQIGRVTVTVKPDIFSQTPGRGADTSFQFDQWNIHYEATGNKVTKFTPPKLTMSIQTMYEHDADPGGPSGYGEGTTPEDIKEGRTSLKYHEGSHGRDFIKYLQDHPSPVFKGAKGMTPKAFEDAMKAFNEDMDKYVEAMKADSVEKTHCVGKTIDQYNHVHGVHCK
jgi:hypothetical protein